MTGGRPLPAHCPSCGGGMFAPAAVCSACGVEVQGDFTPCPVCALEAEDRKLFDLFLASRGNLKRVERSLGVSYPTVRARVETLLQKMGHHRDDPSDRLAVLRRLRAGEISVAEAAKLLRR